MGQSDEGFIADEFDVVRAIADIELHFEPFLQYAISQQKCTYGAFGDALTTFPVRGIHDDYLLMISENSDWKRPVIRAQTTAINSRGDSFWIGAADQTRPPDNLELLVRMAFADAKRYYEHWKKGPTIFAHEVSIWDTLSEFRQHISQITEQIDTEGMRVYWADEGHHYHTGLGTRHLSHPYNYYGGMKESTFFIDHRQEIRTRNGNYPWHLTFEPREIVFRHQRNDYTPELTMLNSLTAEGIPYWKALILQGIDVFQALLPNPTQALNRICLSSRL